MSAPPRVLLAEDDADLRLALKLSLEAAGYAVDVAANAEEALRLQRARQIGRIHV